MSINDHVMSAGWSVSVLRLDTFLPPYKLISGEMEMEITWHILRAFFQYGRYSWYVLRTVSTVNSVLS